MASKQLVVVLTEAADGRQDEYDDYYENTHLDEVIASTGWKAARRYKLVDEAGESCPLPFLAIYEVDQDDAKAILPHLNATRSQRQQSKSLNKRTGRVWVFEATGPQHTAQN